VKARPGLVRRLATPRREDDRGAVAILVAVLTTVFFGLAALVVDLGFAQDQTRKAQNAADAGALAGATCMASLTSGCNSIAAATLKARSYITANGWDGAASTIDVDTTALTVAVTLPPRQSPTFFAGAIGSRNASVARSATATWNGAGSGCSLCVLNDVTLSANADLKMDQGDLLVNGILDLGPNTTVVDTGGRIFANGGVSGSNLSKTLIQDVTGVLVPTAVPTTGPITPPVVDVSGSLGQRVAPSPSGACTAGTYASVGNCTSFAAGAYVLTGLSSFSGNATIQATGVTFVLTCSSTAAGTTRSSACAPNQSGGSIEVKGQATLNVSLSSPPLYASVCFGLAIVSDPNNTGGLLINGSGNGNAGRLNVDGSIYLKSGTLSYGGGPDLTVNGNIIVGNYAGNGNTGTLHALGCGPGAGGGGGGVHLLR
jgi:Flp pilus assembly protein TadG